MRIRRLVTFVAALTVCLALAEAGARVLGVADVPIYDVDDEIGYVPKPNQSGSFLRSRNWAINEVSMGTPRPFAPHPQKQDILLVGDSIVFGGNRLSEAERLGPQLELATSSAVWPISASSWSLQNELAYLRRHPAVVAGVDHIVFVLNSGDFDGLSSWSSDYSHPRQRPLSAAIYAFRRHVLSSVEEPNAKRSVAVRDSAVDFKAVFGNNVKPITIILYPNLEEVDDKALAQRILKPRGQVLKSLDGDVGSVVVVSEDARWSRELYRDAIHPTAAGTALLSRIIAGSLSSPP